MLARYPQAAIRWHPGRITFPGAPAPRLKDVLVVIAYDTVGGARQVLLAVADLGEEEVKILCAKIDERLPEIEGGLIIQASNANDPHGNVVSSDKMPRGSRLLFFTDAVAGTAAALRAAVPGCDIAIFDRQTAHLHVRGDMHSPFSKHDSAFISYGGPDEAIAARITNALKDKGVKTWFFKDDALPGQKLHRMMSDGVSDHDRVIFLCSKESLSRPGVLNELERVLEREAREGGADILMPIALDDYVFKDWAPTRRDIADQVRSRVIGDFRGADTDATKFDQEIDKVVRALSRSGRAP